jgi:hypothetical protein
MTAPLAAFPVVMAPIAAPAAAPLALGWEVCCCWVCVCCWACVAAGGAPALGGCVCADPWGTIAVVAESVIPSDITFTELFICFLLGPSLPVRNASGEATAYYCDPLPCRVDAF